MPRDETKWMLYLSHAISVYAMTGQMPRGEHHPGGWLQAQRSAARRNDPAMTAERAALLDQHLPGWRESARVEDWIDLATAVEEHFKLHNALPRQDGETADERRHANWLSAQRANFHAGRLSPDRARWLSAHLPDWAGRGSRDDAWFRAALELADWISANSRWPEVRSADETERRLAYWFKNRREDARTGRMSDTRHEHLDLLLPGWSAAAQEMRVQFLCRESAGSSAETSTTNEYQ